VFARLARSIVIAGLALLPTLPSAAQQGAGTTLRFVPHADLSILDPYFIGAYVMRTLRDGLKFHDGQLVRVTDVVASLKRWVSATTLTASRFSQLWRRSSR